MERPNVVWVTLESTRADHTTPGGYERDTTPNLQRIAEAPRGRSFDSCIAHGVWTLASSASILTGTYPSHHDAGMESDAIPAGIETIPERLSAAGYHTACLSPNSHLSSATGLDRGFAEFDWFSADTLLETAGPRTILKYLLYVRKHGGGLTTDTAKHGTDFLMIDVAKRRLRSWAGEREPFFLYAHYGGPHHPYHPPRRFVERYAADFGMSADEARELGMDHHATFHERIAQGRFYTDDEWAALRALYDGEIAHADELVGGLFDYVQELDLGETVFVVTADHGELFGEHGLLAHMIVVDDAVTHVPLVVHGLDGLEGGDAGGPGAGELVQHADVMRTILEAAGARTEGLQGIDLREERRERAIVQRGAKRCLKNLDRFLEIDPDFDDARFHRAALSAIRTERFRYQRSEERSELFRLPDEEHDRSTSYPEVVERLDGELERFLETDGRPAAGGGREGEFTDAMERQLADLGYLVD
jgi:uncharacterized sulfatase